MKRLLIALLSLVLVVFVGVDSTSADKIFGVDAGLISASMEAKELLFNRKYDEAWALFEKIETDYPLSPMGLAGKMAIWQLRMFENYDFRFKRQYDAAEKAYKSFALKQLRSGEVPSWDLFIYGAADGMGAYFKLRQEDWLGALSNGLHAMRMFRELKWRERDFPDNDLAFGSYKYWRSAFTSKIKILPFFGDHRAEGIEEVKRAVINGKYAKDIAEVGLVFIYDNEKNWDAALDYSDAVLAKYPQNTIVRFNKGHLLMNKKMFDPALSEYRKVYEQDNAIYRALFYQGIGFLKLKKYTESKDVFKKYLEIEKDKEWSSVAYYWLGQIAEAEKDKALAKDYYRKSSVLYKTKQSKERLHLLEKEDK